MRAILILPLLFGVTAASCRSPADAQAGRLTVVASFYPIAEAARRVGGDAIEVVELTPPGVEPHDIELTPDDIEATATADVVLYAGGGFQPAVEDAIGEAQGLAVDVTSNLAALPPSPEEGGDHAEDPDDHAELAADPHVWLDPERYVEMTATIARTLDDAAPGDTAAFGEAVDRFEAELADLDTEYRDGLAECDSRLLVVNHAAFGYLAEAYDLEQQAIAGLSPEAEPDPERLAELRDIVVSEGVTTIFVESLVWTAVGETLAEEAGVTTAVLNPLEGLTQEQIDSGEDYLSVMRSNLDALRDGLRCA